MYIPRNLAIFTAVFSGALAGMGVSNRVLSDANPGTYSNLVSIAGAFAQEVDTLRGAAPASDLETTNLEQMAQAAWFGRTPQEVAPFFTPSTYASMAAALLAVNTSAQTYFAAQGIPALPSDNNAAVANIAALMGLNDATFTDGTKIKVNTLFHNFQLDRTSNAAVDNITVVNTFSTVGRWLRVEEYVPEFSAQLIWFVDPVNGNDENVGDTDVAGRPLKTTAEVNRRLFMLKAGKNYTINLLNDVPVTDRFRPNGFYEQNAEDFSGTTGFEQVFDMSLIGKRTYSTSSVFTAPAGVSAGNVQANFTDAAPTNPLAVGDMIEILVDSTFGNPLQSATAWIGKDLGGGQYRVSDWRTSAGAISATPPGPVSTYRKVTLTKFSPPVIRMPTHGRLLIANVDIPSPGAAPAERGLISLRYSSITFNTCRISKFFDCSYGANSGQGGCCFFYPAASDYAAGAGQGLANKTVVVVSPAAGIASTGCLFINADVRFWSTSQSWLNSCYFEESLITTRLHTNYTTYGFFAFTPAHTRGGSVNILGNGIRSYDWVLNVANGNAAVLIDDDAMVRVATGSNIGGTHATAVTPVGVLVRNNSKLLIATGVIPTITGAAAEVSLEGATTALPPLEDSAGGVLPALALLVTWLDWDGAPFNRNVINHRYGSSISNVV